MRSTTAALLGWVALLGAHASIYQVDFMATDNIYSEGNMFADGEENFGFMDASDGHAQIDIDIAVQAPENYGKVQDLQIAVAVYHMATDAPDERTDTGMTPDICRQDNVSKFAKFGMQNFQGELFTLGANTTVIRPKPYSIKTSGQQYVRITLCSIMPYTTNININTARVVGTLSFRNKYGFLPAILHGLMPFQLVLTVGYFVAVLVFGMLMHTHRDQLVGVQYFILFVLVISVVSSASWYLAYSGMNDAGTPNCCPFPASLIVACVLQVCAFTRSPHPKSPCDVTANAL
jgi:hypothetical protein